MFFFSNIYIFFFLPSLFLIYYFFIRNLLHIKYLLIIFSVFFYAWWNINYLILIFIVIIINYFFSKALIKNSIYKRTYLIISILFNVLNLLTFKYLNFFIIIINNSFNLEINLLNIDYPLGISFYTFQIITYLVDCYYAKIKKNNFCDFFLFVIFFPQLISGPITKYDFFISQFNNKINSLNTNNILIGLTLFVLGFVKKVYLSKQLSLFVDQSYLNLENLTFINSWLMTTAYSFQIYFDFSGYVDMALGSALLLNIKLPKNFNSPYKSHNLIDFWQKWHITLSKFVMTYMYYPILINYRINSFFLSLLIIFLIFSIVGFWHGPSWMFIVFGSLHGLGVIFNHLFNKYFSFKISKPISILLTFLFVNFTFVFFRSETFDDALKIIVSMIDVKNFGTFNSDIIFYIFFLASIFIVFFCKNSEQIINSFHLNK